jgi:hypothetical protein
MLFARTLQNLNLNSTCAWRNKKRQILLRDKMNKLI